VSFDRLEQGEVAATFSSLSFQAITSFFAFELTGRVSGEERQVRFVVNVHLVGAPEGRREQVLRSLVRDRSRMMRFLWLLLADEGAAVPEGATTNPREGAGGENSSSLLTSGLFEMLFPNLDRAPARLDHLDNLLKELRQGIDGEDLLPAGSALTRSGSPFGASESASGRRSMYEQPKDRQIPVLAGGLPARHR
jgi:hypothetical protein